MKTKKGKSSFKESYFIKNWRLYSMLAVMVVVLAIFCYYPMFGIQLAFKDFRTAIGSQSGGVWGSPWATDEAGNLDILKHFRELFSNPDIFKTFLNTLRLSCLRLLFGFPAPVLLTLFMNELTGERFKKVIQSITYLPYFISWVIISGILTTLTQSGGSFQNFLSSIFGHEIEFFGNSDLFIALLVISDIWKNVGWNILFLNGTLNAERYFSYTCLSPCFFRAGLFRIICLFKTSV